MIRPTTVTIERRDQRVRGICSKGLAPFLPELLARLRRRQALREFPMMVQTSVGQKSARRWYADWSATAD